jgi:hypothetical protein
VKQAKGRNSKEYVKNEKSMRGKGLQYVGRKRTPSEEINSDFALSGGGYRFHIRNGPFHALKRSISMNLKIKITTPSNKVLN